MYSLTTSKDLDALIADIGDRPVVMLGEASHGTHEYYTWRTAITKRLIEEMGFRFIAVEGDWPDCYKINRYIKHYPCKETNIIDVLLNFDRWPTWMWANWEVAALGEWLHNYNSHLTTADRIGFYGLDVYSLWDSMREMVSYLEKEDPAAAKIARKAIHCFEPFEENEQLYARYSLTNSCQDKVVALLKEIRSKAQYLDGEPEAGFNTEQNALIAVNAEKYYRSMMSFDNESWNIRDRHMMETLHRLMKFHGSGAKAIVWEHNTHIGDARATNMKQAGMINLGQLAREKYGEELVYLIGFGSYCGTVIAAEEWGATMEEMELPEARNGSVEDLLHHQSGIDRYLLFNKENVSPDYSGPLPHRAVGVVYDPGNERYGNYVPTVMNKRYDAFIYIDETTALHPFHMQPHSAKMPHTYPFGY
jgi:erythromycin esterase